MFDELTNIRAANIKVIGVGGGGCKAVNRMKETVEGVTFIIANTDLQDLTTANADVKIQLGQELTGGRGSGAKPEVGKKAAQESKKEIEDALQGAHMVFITCGEGGGTGTGAAPVIAEIAQNLGALTIAVVTKPFSFEGKSRMKNAQIGIEELRKHVDSLIVVPNDNLETLIDKNTPVLQAFGEVDNVLRQSVQSISDLINFPGDINLDFSDITTTMKDSGTAVIGIGVGTGEDRAIQAAKQAVQSPLLEKSIVGATKAIINITGGSNLTLYETKQAVKIIESYAQTDLNVFYGTIINKNISDDQIIVTVIATGFEDYAKAPSSDETTEVLDVQKREEIEPVKEVSHSYDDIDTDTDSDYVLPSFLRNKNY